MLLLLFFFTFFFPLYKWVSWIYHVLCFSSASYFSMIAFFFFLWGGLCLSIYFMLITFEHVEFGFNNNQSNWIFAMLLFLPY